MIQEKCADNITYPKEYNNAFVFCVSVLCPHCSAIHIASGDVTFYYEKGPQPFLLHLLYCMSSHG